MSFFAKHYLLCNKQSPSAGIKSADAAHTLTCSLIILNNDLHGENIGRRMTCAEFIDNLSRLNDGQNFPAEQLKALYTSIKSNPLPWSA